ncbi:hypothetical protein [Amycolatopsis sp. NPDC102389]|uniref:hypothetical protein n=1 Tax=Amycolatopsis sp. NPDC102389 TaxID=3363941 RepID=UPI003806D606
MRSEGLGKRRAGIRWTLPAADAPPMPLGVLLPHMELASWLDSYIDRLVRLNTKTCDVLAEEQRADLMVGLSNAAEALRASERCDHESAERMLRSALDLIQDIDLDRFALSAH